ncbi:MAG: LysR family transcriptional regulator, partial [Sphingomicrobium sp.]
MRRLPPLAAVRAFEAAARAENFTAAAAELGMTQAAVSYQVKSLEERLGAPLFVREKGRVKLTALGQRLLPSLSSAFDSIESAFASHREEDESLLTVTTTHTFANTWLAWVLGAFQMEHPDLAVRLSTGNEVVDLRSGDADIAIRAGRGDWEGLEKIKLFDVDFTPMAAPACIAEA